MSKVLKPSRLDVDPNSPSAAKQWKHWTRTFDNFITERGDSAPDKFRLIVNFVFADVCEYLEDWTSYDDVSERLSKMYVKAPNKIFGQYELTTQKQKSGESLDECLEEIKKLCKHCDFEAVTAEVYCSEMIRDSFINGLCSNYICQRLLENAKSTLDEAYEKARTLHIAQKNYEVYLQQNSQPSLHVATATAAAVETDPLHRTPETLAAVWKQAVVKKACYFCGASLHANRKSCPAFDAVYHNCSKKGHFAKIFQSEKKPANLSTIFKPTLRAIAAACPPSLSHGSMPVVVNGIDFTALIDSYSSDSFISKDAFKTLHTELKPSIKKVSMALTSIESATVGHCYVTLDLSGYRYNNIQVDVLKNLRSDIILGYDFQKQSDIQFE